MAQQRTEKNFEADGSEVSLATWKRKIDESSPLVTSSSETNTKVRSLVVSGKELRRNLGFKHAFVFIVGILFGSGIFISPGLIAKQTNSMGMAIMIWVITGIPCVFGALCYCELSCMYGKAGGDYLYISNAYGEVMGFVSLWSRMLVIVPAGLSVLCLAAGQHIVEPFYDLESTTGIWLAKGVALISVLISTIICCVNTSLVGKLQIFFTATQVISVLFLLVLGIWQLSIGHTENYVTMFDNITDFDIGRFGMALYNGLWAYDGWGITATLTEELENVEKNLWLSIVTGIPFVIACYVLINLALMAALNRNEMAKSPTVATTFVEKILGKKAALIIPVAVALSCFGCLNAVLFILARLLLSAAREGMLPYFLCFIHKDRRTPIPALATFFTLTAIWLLLPGINMQSLIASFSFAVWVQYCLAIFSVVVMRIRKPHLPRPFKVWIINPIFTSLIALFLVIIPFVKKPIESTVCLLIMLSAIPVYYLFIKKNDCLPQCLHVAMVRFNEFLTKKFNLVPCIFVENNYESEKKSSQL